MPDMTHKIRIFLFTSAVVFLLLFASSAFAYSDADHEKNMKNVEYAAAFARMEEALKKTADDLHPVMARVIMEEQAEWFAGFDDDYEGAESNIDMDAIQYMEFGGLDEPEAYAAAVADRVEEIEERYLVCWLMANPNGIQGFYQLETEDGMTSILTVRELPQKIDGVYEFDVRLTLEADMGEGTATRVFHNSGRFLDRRMSLFDIDEDDAKPVYVEMWLGDPFKDAMEVIVDDAFKNQPDFDEMYGFFSIEGVYCRKTFP
jgi:hypothetical protein